jgi:hypothetical protein
MPKSVFQQLVEQTCSNHNFKPSNNKAAQQPANGKPNGHSKSVANPSASVGSKSPITNHKSPIARAAEESATPAQSPVAQLIAQQIRDMDAANRAPRCQHIKANGVQCKSPAMRELPFCFFHEKFYNPPYDDSFPPLEDANSVQCAILQVLNGLKTKSITPLEARVMLYGLKAASINSRRTTFEPIMQAQVTEYPSFRRAQQELQQSTAADRVVIPSAAQGDGPAVACHPEGLVGQGFSPVCEPERAKRDQASQMQDFLRAVKEQSSSTAKKPASAASVSAPTASSAAANTSVSPSASASEFDCHPERSEGPASSQRKPPSTEVIPSASVGQGFSPDEKRGAVVRTASSASPTASSFLRAAKPPTSVPNERTNEPAVSTSN